MRPCLILVAHCSMHEWKEDVENFEVSLGFLRQKYLKNQNSETVSESVEAKYNDGNFRRIESRSRPTVLRSKDGGIFGYRVPAFLVSEDLSHIRGLEEWLRKPLSDDLIKELEWEEKMDQMTKNKYAHLIEE